MGVFASVKDVPWMDEEAAEVLSSLISSATASPKGEKVKEESK